MNGSKAFTGFGKGEIVDQSDDEVKVQYPNGTTYTWHIQEIEVPDWEVQLNENIEGIEFETDSSLDTEVPEVDIQTAFDDLDSFFDELFTQE